MTDNHNMPVKLIRRKLTLLPLVMVLFFTVSGGAYGLEDLISASAPGLALLLIIVTPLIWSLPVALMVSELSTALPVHGGYYAWIKTGLSRYWGFQAGWWSWLMSFVDMAIYPVLFADYLSVLLQQHFGSRLLADSPMAHWLTTLAVIWTFTLLNIRGAKSVGDFSKLFGLFVLAPFATMAAIGLYQWFCQPLPVWLPLTPPDSGPISAFGVGLFVVMWNYMGWDIISTIASEIEDPRKNLPRAMALAIPLIVLAYLLPVFAGLTASPDWRQWHAGYFPTLASAIGGPWLGLWLAIGGLASAAGLFNALLLSFSRVPFVMAEDGYLPQALTRTHAKHQTPYGAVILCSAIYSLFSLNAFASLVVVDVVLYSAVLSLEFAALIALRIKRPELPRPYRIPGGWGGLALTAGLPLTLLLLAMIGTLREQGIQALYWSLAALASGPLIFPLLNQRFAGNR